MKILLPVCVPLIWLLAFVSPAVGKTIVDDAGRTVEVPDKIQRVIATHDAVVRLPLYELGVPVVGVWMRTDPATGEHVVLGLRELYDTTAEEVDMTNIGGQDGTDLEVIKQLKPDLIVATEGELELANVLGAIAPVFIQKTYTDDVFGISAIQEMAERFDAMEKYEVLNEAYKEQVTKVESIIPFDPSDKTYSILLIFDQINGANGLSGAIQAITDLGFQQPLWVKDFQEKGFIVPVSSEQIGLIKEDLVVIMNGYAEEDRSENVARGKLDRIASGWDWFLQPEQGVLFVDSNQVITPTFAASA